MKVSDLSIIVTGAASGLGRCFALSLAAEGAQVMAADVDQEGLDDLASSVDADFSGEIATRVCNVADEEQVIGLVKATADVFGKVNGLVNNAGIFRDSLLITPDKETGKVRRMSLKQWQDVIDVDLTGPFLCTREVAAHMVENDTKPGVIINISSVSRHGNRGQSNYSAAKAGLVADTKLWAEELSRYGIRVGAVAPGFVQTPILDAIRPEMLEKLVSQVPLRRAGKPEEIYSAVRFIIDCDYFTGRCVDVDGGIKI